MDKNEILVYIIALILLIPICLGIEYVEARIQAKAYKDSGVIIENIGDKRWSQIQKI